MTCPTSTPAAGYRFADHTGDVALELWAPTFHGLLAQALRGTVHFITDCPVSACPSPNLTRTITLPDGDAEQLLVSWINEVLWLAIHQQQIPVAASFSCEPGGIVAMIQCVEDSGVAIVTEVKSATYHGLNIVRDAASHFSVVVILDL